MNQPYGAAANQYMLQQIQGSTPEHIMFLLMEGAQKFLTQAVEAIRRRDIATRARMVNRTSSIVEEMTIRLDLEGGGELVGNLVRIFDFWLKEIFEASRRNQVERLERVLRQVADMKAAWAELDQRKGATQPAFSAQGLLG